MWDLALVDGAPHFLEVMSFEWFLHRCEVVNASRAVIQSSQVRGDMDRWVAF